MTNIPPTVGLRITGIPISTLANPKNGVLLKGRRFAYFFFL
jgi:hypothetical protein